MPANPAEFVLSDETLQDLAARLHSTRLPPDDAHDWHAGVNPAYLRELLGYWRTEFDWRRQESALNAFRHCRAEIGGSIVHYIHERSRHPNALPVILTHGYPDSFVRFLKLIPWLTDPVAHGGRKEDAFDVVVPSLPGYGYSRGSMKANEIYHVGDLWHELMSGVLGYKRFGAHGGDWGSLITEQLGRNHSNAVVGIHLTDVPLSHVFHRPRRISSTEAHYLRSISEFEAREGAYAMIQGTRPLTLADSLNDSPAGLAAWLVDKFQRWSDCDGEVENRFTKDELLTNVTIYWATQSIGTSFLPYFELMHAGASRSLMELAKARLRPPATPAGFALFPKDISIPPLSWAKRFFHVTRWSQMPRGGHFGAMEEPQLLAEDMRAFFAPLRVTH
ncbi:MAG TPA: epoxide hydrolase [Steroidobacteraceae bacterium]|jgi:pimeloyl-ACP methyl ester carboxylesterase|nr:epoxide hydrolase [Steroidobacteraceae bacterium]